MLAAGDSSCQGGSLHGPAEAQLPLSWADRVSSERSPVSPSLRLSLQEPHASKIAQNELPARSTLSSHTFSIRNLETFSAKSLLNQIGYLLY